VSQVIVIGNDRAPFEGVDDLGSMETEDLSTAEGADPPPLVRAPKRMRGIEQHLQPMAASNLDKRFDIARSPPQMDTDDPRGSGRNHLFGTARVDIVRGRVHVTESRCNFVPLERVSGGDKGKRGDKDLAGETRGFDSDFERYRSIASGDTVANTYQVGDSLLELPYIRTIVGQPSAIQQILDAP
jgi:hypothetical protein